MADLTEIVAALLGHVAQGQAAADASAATMAEAYQRHPLLRHFPAPRAVVREITVDLKFAVKSTPRPTVALSDDQRGDLLDRLASVVQTMPREGPAAAYFRGRSDRVARWEERAAGLVHRVAEVVGPEGEIDAVRTAEQMGEIVASAVADIVGGEQTALPPEVDDTSLQQLEQSIRAHVARAFPAGSTPHALSDASWSDVRDRIARLAWAVPFQRPVAAAFEAHPDLTTAWDAQTESLLERVAARRCEEPSVDAAAADIARLFVDAVSSVLRGGPPGASAAAPALQDVQAVKRAAADRALLAIQSATGRRAAGRPGELELLLTSDELAAAPPEAVGSLRLRIRPDDGGWSSEVAGEAGEPRDEG
jgi:hypothetical protein